MSKNRLKKIYDYRHTLWNMSVSQLKAKYSGSILGISWAIINPLLITLAVTFIFTQVMKTEIRCFSLFVLSVLLPWFFFASAISESATAMKQNIGMLRQFTIPKEIIPISMVTSNLLNFLFGFIVMLPFFAIFNLSIIKFLWLLPAVIFLHYIFTLGVCLLFSVANVYFQDLAQILNVGLMFLFWVTPVFYSVESIPLKWQWVILMNPVTCYVSIYRSLLYAGNSGSLFIWFLCFAFAFLSITSGFFFFYRKESDILKHI